MKTPDPKQVAPQAGSTQTWCWVNKGLHRIQFMTACTVNHVGRAACRRCGDCGTWVLSDNVGMHEEWPGPDPHPLETTAITTHDIRYKSVFHRGYAADGPPLSSATGFPKDNPRSSDPPNPL